jgi:hypothetical protein
MELSGIGTTDGGLCRKPSYMKYHSKSRDQACWKQKMLIDVKKKRNEQTEQAELFMGVHT